MEYRKYNPEGSDLRKAQLRMLDMLKFIDKVCKEHNLQYWLDSGTLLGAARHGGFIPWDDDTDICMPREDFLKFKELMLKEKLHEDYVLQCHETDFMFLDAWIVLRDLKSELIQDYNIHTIQKYKGVQVDIFPMETGINKYWHNKCIAFQRMFIYKWLYFKKKWINYIAIPFYYIFNCIIIPLIRRFAYDKQNGNVYMMSYGNLFWSQRRLEDIYPLSQIKFENIEFCCPFRFDDYLTNLYGDWKKMPQSSEIVTHEFTFHFFN